MPWKWTAILAVFFFSHYGAALLAAELPEGFVEEVVADGLDPTHMALAPDGRIFITQKSGEVYIVREGVLLPDPFVTIEVDNFNERGLQGLAFHPNFEENNWIYFYYTVPGLGRNRVSRFTANGDVALAGSEEVILDLDPMPGTVHNGGDMAFGPDGKLYVSTGDGATSGNSQLLTNLLGKVLRINDDGSIPSDNPFYDNLSGKNRAIWAYGFRNPFSMAIQPGTGRIFVCDVGQSSFEEVNHVQRGGNYGWDRIEGYANNQETPPDYVDPLYAYSHSEGCSVVGAEFYNPDTANFPEQYRGKFFFGDFCGGFIRYLDPETGALEGTFASGIDRPLGILVTPGGSMYYLERRGIGGGSPEDNTSSTNARLWRVTYTGSGAPFVSLQPESILRVQNESARFAVKALGADPLSYQWRRDGEDLPGANGAELLLPSVALEDDGASFRCIISNAIGSDTSARALLSVTDNTRPQPRIISPAPGWRYRAGDVIRFEGAATDAEDGELANDHLNWRIDFHHDNHTHPGLESTSGIGSGNYQIPTVGEIDDNVWYRIYLTAEDREGLRRTVQRDIYPVKTQVEVRTRPAGLPVIVDGRPATAPDTVRSVVGIVRTLQAEPLIVTEDSLYIFSHWEGGSEELLFSYAAPEEPATYIAHYEGRLRDRGGGLHGAYFKAPDAEFDSSAVFTRIDSVIQFNWALDAPDNELLEGDFFAIRWTGGLRVLQSGEYTFYTTSDDGVRLWVDDQLVIDQWIPQGPTEHQGRIQLQAGRSAPIKLEYFERQGGAMVELRFQHDKIPKQIIPAYLLFPATEIDLNRGVEYELFPNPARDVFTFQILSGQVANHYLHLFNGLGQRMWSQTVISEALRTEIAVPVANLPAGVYYLLVESGGKERYFPVMVH